MRFALWVSIFLAATPAFALTDFSTKAGCLRELERRSPAARTYPKYSTVMAEALAEAPDIAEDQKDRIIEAWQQIGNAYADMQDALLSLCAAYD